MDSDVLTPRRRHGDVTPRRFRRGVYLIPSLLTLGNMLCGYACVLYTMRGEFATAAPFIGIAFILDGLDGRVARMTGSESKFGLEFDSLADIVSFGLAPAVMAYRWGLTPFGRWGWAAGFIYLTAAAMRLARFNIQSGTTDKRFYVGMPSPAAAGVVAATIFAYPAGLRETSGALPVMALMLVPAFLMVSTIRFRSFKGPDLQSRRSYTVLLVLALIVSAVFANPQAALVVLAYGYLFSAFVELAVHRVRRRSPEVAATPAEQE
jgi:CDP-diacylglycerol--serine O-phosphatidyltransferase